MPRGRRSEHPIQEFNGIKYYHKREGYFKADFKAFGITKYMHRDVWEFHNGPIPGGFCVHHKDGNKANNRIENLELLSDADHTRQHMAERVADNPDWWRPGLDSAQKAARSWHGTPEGLAWHAKNGVAAWEKREKGLAICTHCGKSFETFKPDHAKYCGPNCTADARRKSGVDNESRTCAVCGGVFSVNKYSTTKTCGRACGRELTARTQARIRADSGE